MNKFEIVDNSLFNKLDMHFINSFEDIYAEIKTKGKTQLIKYISAFFRKWYYSTLIEDTVITPCYIAEYGNNEKSVYPVIKSHSVKRIGQIDITNIKYSVDNHPICSDFRSVVNAFRGGIALDDELQMDFDDIKSIENLTSFDVEYVAYISMLAIDMGYVEKMPSITTGITIFCASKKVDDLENISNKNLLKYMTDAALTISSTYLSDDFMGERYNITADMVRNWIVNPETVDKIFEQAYGEIVMEVLESMSPEDMDDMERAITAKYYARGVVIDKWFLTPFSYYFRYIDTTYMYEFSFEDELTYFVNALKSCEEYFEDAVISSAIYSPCTLYKLSHLGAEFFDADYNSDIPYIFKKLSVDEVINAALLGGAEEREKIMSDYEPEFDVYELRIYDADNEEIYIDIQTRGSMTLEVLHTHITNIFRTPVILCRSYRFYKLPESPFTEYSPQFIKLRGPHTEDTVVSDVLEEGEELYYEIIVMENDTEECRKINIKLMKVAKNEKGAVYPRVCKSEEI